MTGTDSIFQRATADIIFKSSRNDNITKVYLDFYNCLTFGEQQQQQQQFKKLEARCSRLKIYYLKAEMFD